jgi:lipopolysaccharide transport system ATP-binding protein
VGDAEFQKKCLGKMKDVSKEGRTVIFVSHNMSAVKSLCNRAIVLEKGEVVFMGETDQAVSKYLGSANGILNFKNEVAENDGFNLKIVEISSRNKNFSEPIIRTDEILLKFNYDNQSNYDEIHFTIKMKGEDGNYFLTTSSSDTLKIEKGSHTVAMILPAGYLNDGMFFIDLLVVANQKTAFIFEVDVLSFLVNPEPKPIGVYMGKEQGYIRSNLNWEKL